MFKLENETDLHYKVVHYIRGFRENVVLSASLGENQDTSFKRIDSYRKGYQKGKPGILIMSKHDKYAGFCIEFKTPNNNYYVSEDQLKMKNEV